MIADLYFFPYHQSNQLTFAVQNMGSEYALTHPRLSPAEGERIPTLEAVAARARSARSPFWLFVELKSSTHPDSGDPISLADEALAVMESYLDLTVFVGFDWRGLRRIKQ